MGTARFCISQVLPLLFAEVYRKAVVGLLGRDVNFISVYVDSFEGCHVGVSERGEGTEAEEIPSLCKGSSFMDCLFFHLADFSQVHDETAESFFIEITELEFLAE